MSTLPKHYLTPEEYLEIDRKAERKSEYFAGEMFAMAGASAAHNSIVANLVGEFRNQLRKRPCTYYPSDMRVQVSGLYTYPDVTVVCGEAKFRHDRGATLLNPTVIAEVLSESTEACDRGRKFDHYVTMESLSAYLLVSSDRVGVQLFTRLAQGWFLSRAVTLEDSIEIQAIDCRLRLADVYEKVEIVVES